jgi:hypothetical protein
MYDNDSRTSRHALRGALFGACMLAPALAAATDFPVTGTISVNGNLGDLPAGVSFGPSDYDAETGAISAATFTFPPSTASFNSQFGTVVVHYQLTQTNTSDGQVAGDGTAALSMADMQLSVVSVTISGFPVDVGTCVLQPLELSLDGSASAAGLDLADPAFTIPEVGASDCGGYGSQINDAIAGSNNSIALHLAGDFTPPQDTDTIFANGFDLPG